MRTVAALCRELLPDRRADGELLAAFTSERSEVPFAELVRRHGPLVWGTCHRLLPDPADAEDAFQATFLVLVRQAGRLATRDTVGPWLHRVAVWTARNVRRKNARRLVRQRELPDELPTSSPDSDLRADIDAALLALPARLRDPIILCHLQGFTRREAAERLGYPEGTLSSWLDRGLAKLRVRLRDLDPLKALGVPLVAVPLALTTNTTKAAVASGVAAVAIPPAISSIVEGVLHMLWIKKATAATFALCAVFALGVGVGLGTRPGSTGVAAEDGPPKPGASPKPAPTDNTKEVAALEEAIRAKKAQVDNLFKLALPALRAFEDADRAAHAASNPLGAPEAAALKAFRTEVERVNAALKEAATELKELNDKLAKLKGDKAPPAKDDAEKDDAREAANLARVKAQLAQAQAAKAQASAQRARAEQELAAAEAELQALQRYVELAERAKQNKSAATTSYLEIAVSAKGNAAEYVVLEGAPGAAGKKPLGPVTTSDPAALALLLKRAKADPSGPQEARIRATADTPAKLVQAAADACKAAGFKAITADVTGGNKKTTADPGSSAEKSAADLQEFLNKYKLREENEQRLVERQKKELDESRKREEGLRKLVEEELRKKREPKP